MVADYLEIPRPAHTLEEYFALLDASDRRWEFWGGELLCMSGGTPEHAIISSNVFSGLAEKLKGRDCRVFGPDMAIRTPSLPPFRFPDLSVICGKPSYEKAGQFKALTNPLILIEVLSTSTEYLDREPKRLAYQALPSVREYLLIGQSAPQVTRFVRQGKRWRRFEYDDLNAVVGLSSVQCALPLSAIYRDIEFR